MRGRFAKAPFATQAAPRAGSIGLAVQRPFHNTNVDALRQAITAHGSRLRNVDAFDDKSGRNDTIRAARSNTRKHPRDASAWGFLAKLLKDAAEYTESRRCLEKAIVLDPDTLGFQRDLAQLVRQMGDRGAAEQQYREILARTPGDVVTHLDLASLLNDAGQCREALACAQRAIDLDPVSAKAFAVAAAIAFKAARYAAALNFIDQAIALRPDVIGLLARRADTLSRLGRNDEALADIERVLRHGPDIEGFRVKAVILQDNNRPEDALGTLLCAEAAYPHNAGLKVDRAWLLAEIGRQAEALELLGRVLSDEPDFARALECRAFLSRPRPDDPDLLAMERIVDNPGAPSGERERLSFAIGRAYLDARDGERAFHYLTMGNALKRQSVNYNPALEESWFSSLQKAFSAEMLSLLPDSGSTSTRPIFVFGMPRSGTTLVEQILASHPLVQGTGETPHLERLARSEILSHGMAGLAADNLARCAEAYMGLMWQGGAVHFVDKTNSNFLYAGLISRLFPQARMIHCRRAPLDTCLSCYALHFAHGHEFSYDLGELGHYYSLYRNITAHWHAVLPQTRLLGVDYEDVITDTQTQVRRILDFCGLPWDDACLRFHETRRTVSTSSLSQVRSPIYTSSLGRAEFFRPWLGELIDALGASSRMVPPA